jgi:3-oxoacyl-[acyl-carrier protein] reductase
MQLDGKIALVTGGSRGIGRAVVERLAADALVAEQTAAGHKVRALQADVRDAARAQQVVDELVEKQTHLDILVNSAGIVRDGLLGSMTAEQWRDVLETNLFGTYNYCRAVTQQMMYQRSGAIVNLSSTASEFASRGQVNYAASKGGIDGLTRGMAKELAPRKIRVNAVAPGMIETDMSKAVRGLVGDKIKDFIPLKRIGKPAEIAAVVAFLASDQSSYMTGQILRVDGGLSLGGY